MLTLERAAELNGTMVKEEHFSRVVPVGLEPTTP